MQLIPRVIAAERFEDGLLLAFEDNVLAFYSAAVLRAALDRAQRLDEAELEDE